MKVMTSHSRTAGVMLVTVVAMALAGCGGGSAGTNLATAPPTVSPSVSGTTETLDVSPRAPVLLPGEKLHFTAKALQAGAARGAASATVPQVNWYVNGIPGGNAVVGTISSDGTYNSPAKPVSTVVKAVSRDSATVSASAAVTVSATAEEAVRPTIFRIVGENTGPAPTAADAPITINGANFATDAKVMVAGQQRPATVVSSHQIKTTLPSLTAAGEVPLFVINPGTPERIAARNLHVAKDYDHAIQDSAVPLAAARVVSDPIRNRVLLVNGFFSIENGTVTVDAVAIDLEAHKATGRFAIPSFLADLDASTGKLYVLQAADSTKWYGNCSIDVFDTVAGQFLNSISLAPGSCTDIRVHPALHRVYIPDNQLGAVRVVNLETGLETAAIGPFAPSITVRLTPGSSTAVVASGTPATSVALVDLTTDAVTRQLQLVAPASEFTLDEARGRLYVASTDNFPNFEMRAYELASNDVLAYVAISDTPFANGAMLLSPDGTQVLVSALSDGLGDVIVGHTSTGDPVYGGGNGGNAWIIDAESVTVRSRIPLTGSGYMTSVGNTIVSAWYTVTMLDVAKDLGARQLGAMTASRNGADQIDLSITGVNLSHLQPMLYFDGATVELTPVAGQQSAFKATVPLSWAESTQLHSVWMGALDTGPTNVLGFGFSPQPIGGDARNATFCLGNEGMAILADKSAARWLDLRKGTELRRTTPGAVGCTFDDTGVMAILRTAQALEVYAANTATLLTTASVPGDWWNKVVVDSSTGLAYTSSSAVIDTQTGNTVETLPHMIGWDNRLLGFDGFLGIDSQTHRLVSYWYSLDLTNHTITESGLNYAIAGPDGAAAPWGMFGVDTKNHLAIMPWRYGKVVLIDMQTGKLQTARTGGELYFGACAGDGLGFVLDRVTPAVLAVDLRSGETVAKFASAPLPSECAYDRDTQTLWVLSAWNGELFKIEVGQALSPTPPPTVP
ncbi:MAG: IPT/TIG domain-containing protein [Terriglobales bacterium]